MIEVKEATVTCGQDMLFFEVSEGVFDNEDPVSCRISKNSVASKIGVSGLV